MEIKKIRKLMALISGGVVALIAVIFLLTLDTKVNIGVSWLMGMAVFGVAGGVLQFIATQNSEDEENSKSPILSLIAMAFIIGFVVVLVCLAKDSTYLAFVNSKEHNNAYLKVIYYFTLIIGVITCIISIFHGITVMRDHWGYLKSLGEKGESKISLMRVIVPCVAFVLIISSYVLLMFLDFLEGSYISGTIKNADGSVRWTESTYVNFRGMGVFFGLPFNEFVLQIVKYKLPADKPTTATLTQYLVQSGLNIVLFLIVTLVFIALITYIVFICIPKFRKSVVARSVPGAFIFIFGFMMFFTKNYFVNIVSINNPTLVDGLTFKLGLGPILFATFTSIAGFVLTIYPLFDINLASDKLLVLNINETSV